MLDGQRDARHIKRCEPLQSSLPIKSGVNRACPLSPVVQRIPRPATELHLLCPHTHAHAHTGRGRSATREARAGEGREGENEPQAQGSPRASSPGSRRSQGRSAAGDCPARARCPVSWGPAAAHQRGANIHVRVCSFWIQVLPSCALWFPCSYGNPALNLRPYLGQETGPGKTGPRKESSVLEPH